MEANDSGLRTETCGGQFSSFGSGGTYRCLLSKFLTSLRNLSSFLRSYDICFHMLASINLPSTNNTSARSWQRNTPIISKAVLRGKKRFIAKAGNEPGDDGGDPNISSSLKKILSTWVRDIYGEANAFTKDISKSAVHVGNVMTPRQAVRALESSCDSKS